MLHGRTITVALPAYDAQRTLRRTRDEIPRDVVDDIILTDDASSDQTVLLAESLGVHTIRHDRNRGYGGTQETCHAAALDRGVDVVVMLHPDDRHAPKPVTAMASMIASDEHDVVLASRILGGGTSKDDISLCGNVADRSFTAIWNAMADHEPSEYPDDFVFDDQGLAQTMRFGFRTGEMSCPTRYFPEASSINIRRSIVYGAGMLRNSCALLVHRLGRDGPLLRAEPIRAARPAAAPARAAIEAPTRPERLAA